MFDAESDRLARLLGVLQTIEAAPEPPSCCTRRAAGHGALGHDPLRGHPGAGRARRRSSRRQLQEVATLRALQEAAVATLEEGLQGVQRARTELSQAVANRTDLPRRLITDDGAMENLLNSADTLESFAGGLCRRPRW